MKSHLVLPIAVAVTALSMNHIQAQQSEIHCVVPFAFHVAEKTLPAGDYLTVQHNGYKTVQNRVTGQTEIASIGNPNVSGAPGARMVFNKYGNTYFLEEIWTDQQTGSRVPVSKEEQNLRREAEVLAQNTVTIIAQR